MSYKRAGLAVAAMAAVGSFALAAPAAAAPEGSAGTGVAAMEPPPGCVDASVDTSPIFTEKVKVTNNCLSTQRVKVLVAFAPDSECYVISPADSRTHTYPANGRFDGLQAC